MPEEMTEQLKAPGEAMVRNAIALDEQRSDSNQFVTLEAGHMPMSPDIIRNSILGLETALKGLPPEEKFGLETMHNFIDGIYARTVMMRAGTLITGRIHKLEHMVIVSQGSASVVSEEFGSKQINAPCIFISPPGVKRLLFIHHDMIWTTIHPNPTNTRDTDQLERELTVEHYGELSGSGAV